MIDGVNFSGLRGVRRGELADLAPLTVLVGKNGSGKSTVLEALAIGAAHQPAVLVGDVVRVRGGWNGASYLIARDTAEARLEVLFATGERRVVTAAFQARASGVELADVPPGHHPGEAFSSVLLRVERGGQFEAPLGEGPAGTVIEARTVFHVDNAHQPALVSGLGREDRVRFVHPPASRAHPLWRTLGDAVKSGRAEEVFTLLRELLGPAFLDLYPIPEGETGQVTNVHLRYAWGTVPVDVAGDGVRSLVRLALELAGRPESVILVEEPEVHQHPGALQQSAQALLAAASRGVQVVLSTHSLELIDALVDHADMAALDRLAVVRLALVDGVLRSHRIAGPQVKVLRRQVAEDLR